MTEKTEKKPKRKPRIGCLVALLVPVLLVAAVAWKLGLFQVPALRSKAEKDMLSAPAIPAAGQAVAAAFSGSGVKGASAVVVYLPEGKGTVAAITLDTGRGFAPPKGAYAKRQQALAVIRRISAANTTGRLDLQRVVLEYREAGKPALVLTAPMEALTGVADGKLSDAKFLARVGVKVRNAQWALSLAASFLK
jgi:hypothetical protein